MKLNDVPAHDDSAVKAKPSPTARLQGWREAYAAELPTEPAKRNRSGIEIRPLYTSQDHGASSDGAADVPGDAPYTRGIYTTMHRGRSWTQRQLIGLGTPEDYNNRLREVLAAGSTAISLLPCNSVFRGYDMDQSHPELLGTCGTVVNTPDHMRRALEGVDLTRISIGLNDPTPFTLLAFLLVEADRQSVPWAALTGTANQSDYLSHYVANHMFYRLDLAGARRLLVDKIAYCNAKVPRYNPLSVVGQHMQQAGATPAEAMAFTLSSAVQYARDCIARGMEPDVFLPRFTFFFDISVSFFEEVAKFRAGRRVWARITKEQLGAQSPRSWRMKFHGQTSGADLTRQQPLNNISRVTVQAMAGILGGLQSLHTDAYDEAISCPTGEGARIAVATQNILRSEAGLTDVIDPLGGSHYVEALTDAMEAEILRIMALVEDVGGMYAAASSGLVQRMIGRSAMDFQRAVESGERPVVGVNCYQAPESGQLQASLERPDAVRMEQLIGEFKAWKASRSQDAVRHALDALARVAESADGNAFESVVGAARAGATHQEICDRLRETMGFGAVQVIV
ncbi:MAG: acyl-CoA mutase large subunit family protein [Ramlibacter sp.]